jgi:hypothetical protein
MVIRLKTKVKTQISGSIKFHLRWSLAVGAQGTIGETGLDSERRLEVQAMVGD